MVGGVIVVREVLRGEDIGDDGGLDLSHASLAVISSSPDDDKSSLASNLIKASLHTLFSLLYHS